MGAPVVQAAAHTNHVVNVYADRVEIRSGRQGQNVESVALKDVTSVSLKGLVNCTLTITSNTGRVFELRRMALPEARAVKRTVEEHKRRAGIYE